MREKETEKGNENIFTKKGNIWPEKQTDGEETSQK